MARCAREVADFVDAGGWGQSPQMFALVPTAALAAAEPGLLDDLADGAALTPIQQGCALVQEIVVLPPAAESALDDALMPLLADPDAADNAARSAAENHPEKRDARLIVAVLKDGPSLTLLQLHPDEDADPFAPVDLRIAEDLAPNVVHGLYATFDVVDDE
ncbi:MAG: PPA1309 family protein [Rhodococcus sp.]|nr:PPA1309 family protein [Rhodococcus sp. (in: high G+C Gram-positive bacteria)]MCX6493323.1 PPA1309 family protein [Rhodococcus sp. (in: high G+C Gram-positive bacteria)]